MRKNVIKVCVCFLFSGLFFMHSNSFADDIYLPPRQELLTGIGLSRIHDKGNYNLIPFFWDINFNIKKFFENKGIHPPGVLNFVWETEAAYVFTPDNDAEIANNFLIKFGFLPSTSRWQPYFKGGIGTILLTEHVHGQATQFNFNEYAGLGLNYFFNPRIAMTIEYRFRHLSNAAIKYPNHGFNTNFVLAGICVKL